MSGDADGEVQETRLVRVLHLAEQLVALNLELGEAVKAGLFDLVSARYSKPVCAMQYDMNMRATTRIEVACGEPGIGEMQTGTKSFDPTAGSGEIRDGAGADETRATSFRFTIATARREDGRKGTTDSVDTFFQNGDGNKEGARRRAGKGGSVPISKDGHDEQSSSTLKQNQNNSCVKKIKNENDPLFWFGALPSSSLRDAQRRFVTCVELTARIATVASEIKAMTAGGDISRVRKEVGR
jgi:hypothetical protein|tara:strand:- start:2221 stop:2940 length:720 start_codon:yes stop_codon:yes gene_type:complete